MKKVGRILLLAIIGGILIATFKFLWDNSRPEAVIYEIVSPQMGSIENTTTATGNLEPRNEVAVKPEIPGTISKIYKEVGEPVNEGEVIATLIITPDVAQLNAAESRVRTAEITLEQVSKEYKRQTTLFENGVISKNEYEVTEANYRKALEEKSNARDALEIVKIGSIKKSGSVDNTQVRSRSAGTVLDIPIKIGNRVIQPNPYNDGTTIAIVANMNDLIFRGTIDETEVGRISEGMPISISVGAITNETIEAVLEYIAPKGKKENGTVLYEIKAAVKTPKATLIRANYSANANIILNQVINAVIVPESSIEFDNGIACVYVLNRKEKKQIFLKKPIEIGLSDGVNVEVKSGLHLEDKIRGRKIEFSESY
jgi:HlyD family secretion protein